MTWRAFRICLGSTTGAVECLDAVLDVVPHALDLLSGGHPH